MNAFSIFFPELVFYSDTFFLDGYIEIFKVYGLRFKVHSPSLNGLRRTEGAEKRKGGLL